VALLPDGEVHACRKWPSPIGNVASSSFNDIYFSAKAKAIRRGSAACRTCKLKKSCGGCPAVVFGRGLDPAKDRDPHCFLERRQELLAGF
jgi:radical SAM protein with 4Fe4S-binding SPASM domain